MEWIKKCINCFMILFSIIDIIGNTPTIINFKIKGNFINSKKVILVSFCIFLSFLFLGQSILNIIGIDINSFSVAGSIVLFFIALEMILGIEFYKTDESTQTSVIPIAFPLIAGPGSLTTLISLRSIYNIDIILISLIINMLIAYFVIKKSDFLAKKISKNGLNTFKKVFGIILLAFAVKMFAVNVFKLI